MSQHVPFLDAAGLDEALASTAGPLLVDFTARWCPPCKTMAPILDELAHERDGSLRIVKVDVDEQPEVAARYGVQSMPTFLLFDAGEPVARLVGARPKRRLEAEIEPWAAKGAEGAKACADC